MTKEALIIILGICFSSLMFGQNIDSEYFSISTEDETRWNDYEKFIANFDSDFKTKADSILKFAQKEYELKQFFKTRELCELAISLNPDFGEAHNLIGKSYVSSSKLCNKNDENAHRIKEEIIWAAIDEWEIAISKANSKKEEAIKLIDRYSLYLPSEEHFRSCFVGSSLNEGDDFLVGCWIQKNTKVRFNKKK